MYVLRFGHCFDYPFIKNLCNILGFMIQLYFILERNLINNLLHVSFFMLPST